MHLPTYIQNKLWVWLIILANRCTQMFFSNFSKSLFHHLEWQWPLSSLHTSDPIMLTKIITICLINIVFVAPCTSFLYVLIWSTCAYLKSSLAVLLHWWNNSHVLITTHVVFFSWPAKLWPTSQLWPIGHCFIAHRT